MLRETVQPIPSKFLGTVLVPTYDHHITSFESQDKRIRLYVSSDELRFQNTYVLELGDGLGVCTYRPREQPLETSVGWRVGFLETITKTTFSTYARRSRTTIRRHVRYRPIDFDWGRGRRRPPSLVDTLVKFDPPCSGVAAVNRLGLKHKTFAED